MTATTTRPTRVQRDMLAGVATLVLTCAVAPALCSANVLVASSTLGVSSGIYEFDDNGQLLRTFVETSGGSVFFSIAAQGNRVISGQAYVGFHDYTTAGVGLGLLSGIPKPTEGAFVEFDSHGNIYITGSNIQPRRLAPDGTTSLVLPTSEYGVGIDADGEGNIYVTKSNGVGLPPSLNKFSPTGALLSSTSGVYSDIAIDEAGKVLYAVNLGASSTTQTFIGAYDISGATPVFLHNVPVPRGLAGFSFDSTTGHLLVTNLLGGSAQEITTDGVVVRIYSLPGTNPFDIVAIRVPEPGTAALLILACSAKIVHRQMSKSLSGC